MARGESPGEGREATGEGWGHRESNGAAAKEDKVIAHVCGSTLVKPSIFMLT